MPVATTTANGELVVVMQRRGEQGDSLCIAIGDEQAMHWTPPDVIVSAEPDVELAPGRKDIVGTPRPVILDENTVLTVSDAPDPQVMSSGPIHVRYLRRNLGTPK